MVRKPPRNLSEILAIQLFETAAFLLMAALHCTGETSKPARQEDTSVAVRPSSTGCARLLSEWNVSFSSVWGSCSHYCSEAEQAVEEYSLPGNCNSGDIRQLPTGTISIIVLRYAPG